MVPVWDRNGSLIWVADRQDCITRSTTMEFCKALSVTLYDFCHHAFNSKVYWKSSIECTEWNRVGFWVPSRYPNLRGSLVDNSWLGSCCPPRVVSVGPSSQASPEELVVWVNSILSTVPVCHRTGLGKRHKDVFASMFIIMVNCPIRSIVLVMSIFIVMNRMGQQFNMNQNNLPVIVSGRMLYC